MPAGKSGLWRRGAGAPAKGNAGGALLPFCGLGRVVDLACVPGVGSFRSYLFYPGGPMRNVTIEIPGDVAKALRLPPDALEQEARKELAVALYARQLLPLGKARKLAGMTRRDFEELLGERHVPRAYDEKDLERDIAYGLGYDPAE